MKKNFKAIYQANRASINKKATAFLFIFSLGLLAGFFIERHMSAAQNADAVFDFQKIHPLNNHFEFINPLIGFDTSEKKYSEYAVLKNKIKLYLDSPDVSGKASDVSIYFRNLETGDWMGIDQNQDYDPASLLKVPIMLLYFKLAESDPGILSRTYAYTKGDLDLLRLAKGSDETTRLIEGKQYTIEELIREMIVRSDNIAKYLLVINSPSDFNEIYGDLGVEIHKDGHTYTISARTYSLFFRTLYNSTFLNQEMSEKALKLLSESEFKNGLVAGVDSGVKVAHKFGQYTRADNGRVTSVEAHDCGIVYYPHAPYLLCVMTRGNDTNQLEEIIQQVSRITYDFVQ